MHQVLAALVPLLAAACAPAASGSASAEFSPTEPELFAYDDLRQEGRITFTPAISPDGQTMYFTQADCRLIWECPQQLFVARRTPSGWSVPERITATAGDRVEWPSFSPDGKMLLFSWATERPRHRGQDVYEDFDLYRLALDRPDALPEPIDNPDINRIRGGRLAKLRFVNNETAPSLTENGDLYFWTERLDGVGARDVYVAPADGRGGFGQPRALAAPVNSRGNDAGVWVRPDGRLMLINYSERGGQGGTDVFVSVRRDGEWSDPVNLGPALNSPHEEFAARLTPDGKQVLFTSDRPVGDNPSGLFQVWSVPVAAIPVLADAIDSLES